MPQPFETLVYVARLRKEEKAALFAQEAAFPSSGLMVALLEAVEDVCLDRLVRADACLGLARRLADGSPDEETLRAAIGRAYYSVHHALRAMALWQNKWDPDGHEESITEFKALLEDRTFRHRSGLTPDVLGRILEARTNRHIADYSSYNIQRNPPQTRWLGITNGSWTDAVQFNIDVADGILQAAVKCVGS